MILLSFTLVSSVSASFPSSYLDYSNLLDEYHTVNAVFNNGSAYPFYYVELEPSTTYTFVAPTGSDSFLASPLIETWFPGSSNIYPHVYSYDSQNWYIGSTLRGNSAASSYQLIFVFRVTELGTYYLNFDYSVSGSTLLYCYGSNDLGDFYPANQRVDGSGSVSWSINVDRLGSTGASNIYLMLVPSVNISYTFSNVYFSNEPTSQYIPGWATPSYSDGYIQTYTFTTAANGGGTYVIGFKDSMLVNNNQLFSREQAANSKFYLVEGDLDFDSFYDYYYNNGFDDGYDDGYSKGETSGLESSMFMRNIFFTIVSSPFIFIRNALDFDFLGINFRDLAMIIISATLVAWVIRTFKKGE